MEQPAPDRDLQRGPAASDQQTDVAAHDSDVEDPIEHRQIGDAVRGAQHDNPFPLWRRIVARLTGS